MRWVSKTRVGLPNLTLARATYENLVLVGAPRYTEEARNFARAIQQNLGLSPMEDPLGEDVERVIPPEEYEARLRTALPAWQTHFTSDDYVEYTWHAPTVRLYTARPRLRPPYPGYAYPAWTDNALGGRPEIVDPGMFVAGKVIAATLLDLVVFPELREQAWTEFRERTGGGIGGEKWVSPLIPADFFPPIDLRWPVYVTTVRGEEWWIPTPKEEAYTDL